MRFDSKRDSKGFSVALRHEVSFFGLIQYSPVDGCSAVSCNFGILAEDERTSFYSTILCNVMLAVGFL